ncbi:MAG TPA: hypothetical protein VMV89_02740 [Candidatus Paceibacterota bacterium]|nr:hypothetical protein [Candidatus Paceibacterota bacterium]
MLHFKSIGKSDWSVRVGGHYRAVGKFSGEIFLWEWIGSHEEYNKRFLIFRTFAALTPNRIALNFPAQAAHSSIG